MNPNKFFLNIKFVKMLPVKINRNKNKNMFENSKSNTETVYFLLDYSGLSTCKCIGLHGLPDRPWWRTDE